MSAVTTRGRYASDGQGAYLGAVLGNLLSQLLDDASVDVEEVVTGHAWLAWHSGRDHHQVSTCQACREVLLSCVASHLRQTRCIMLVEMTGPQLQFGRTPRLNCMHTASREAMNASHADACNPAVNVSIHNRQFQICGYGPQTAPGTSSAILADADQCLITDLNRGVAVAEVCCHPNSVGDIIQG